MSKKRKKTTVKKRPSTHKSLPVRAYDSLEEVDRLISRKQWHQALEALRALNRHYPKRPEILGLLTNVCAELNDMRLYLHYILGLQKIQPNDPESLFNLATAYSVNFYPALARHTYQQLLARHPHHEQVDQAQESLVLLEKSLEDILADLEGGIASRTELAIENDRMRLELDTGQFREARRTASKLLNLNPTFIPALNNLSLVEFMEGNLSAAIKQAESALALDPSNFQALGNLTKYLHLNGQTAAAQEKATQFEELKSTDDDIILKKVETFTYLGDDRRIRNIVRVADSENRVENTTSPALVYHLAAVAEMGLGNDTSALAYWKRALKSDLNLALAKENMADLENPIGERHAPWPFSGNQWLPTKTLNEVRKVLDTFTGKKSEKARKKSMERLIIQHPELKQIMSILLEQGDPWGRDFASMFIFMTEIPVLQALLPKFALSKKGPDAIRHEAATIAQEAGLLPSKEIRMWIQGEWKDITLLNFEIHYEHDDEFDTPELAPLITAFSDAYEVDDLDKAAESLQAILRIKPDSPSILNNLATIYRAQDKEDQTQALLDRIQADFPDYFFGIVSKASKQILEKDFKTARELLTPLLLKDRLHISEFTALARAQLQLNLAEDNFGGARQWIELWEEIEPDNAELDRWRFRVMSQDQSLMESLEQAMKFLPDF